MFRVNYEGLLYSASKYTDFSVYLRKSHSIYGEDKSAQEGVASITTNGQVRVSTGKAKQNTGEIATGDG
jgi:hypothetical protein